MTKDEFITLIKVAEAITKIDKTCRFLTSIGLDDGSCNDVFLLWSLLQDNSAPRFRTYDTNNQLDTERYRAFCAILENPSLSPEEKYALLTSDEEDVVKGQ